MDQYQTLWENLKEGLDSLINDKEKYEELEKKLTEEQIVIMGHTLMDVRTMMTVLEDAVKNQNQTP